MLPDHDPGLTLVREEITVKCVYEMIPKPPTKSTVLSITFTSTGAGKMKGTVKLSDVVPGDNVTSRKVKVSLNSAAALPDIEAISSAATFDCAEGDSVSVVVTDVNDKGQTDSDPFSSVAHIGGGTGPTKPHVLDVTYTNGGPTPPGPPLPQHRH